MERIDREMLNIYGWYKIIHQLLGGIKYFTYLCIVFERDNVIIHLLFNS